MELITYKNDERMLNLFRRRWMGKCIRPGKIFIWKIISVEWSLKYGYINLIFESYPNSSIKLLGLNSFITELNLIFGFEADEAEVKSMK